MKRENIKSKLLLLLAVLLFALIIMLVVFQAKESNRPENLNGITCLKEHPLWLSRDYANAEFSDEEKFEALNSIWKSDISEALVFFNSGTTVGQYFEVKAADNPEMLERLIGIYFDEDITYNLNPSENQPREDVYDYYVTVVTEEGQSYTIFYLKGYEPLDVRRDYIWFCGSFFAASQKIDSWSDYTELYNIYQHYREKGLTHIPGG